MNKLAKKRNKKRVFTVMLTVVSVFYAIWRTLFTLPLGLGWASLVFGILLLVCELCGVFEILYNTANQQKKETQMPEIDKSMYPDVDIFIATHNEDTDLLYKTINGCNYLKYPDKSKMHIYVCDDNNRAEMAELAQRMDVGYFGLSGNKHAKAGNLNNALMKSSSPLIVTLDADMIPVSNFLLETAPYFFLPDMKLVDGKWEKKSAKEREATPKTGFVQTPQRFYNADMFQYNLYAEKNIPNEQDYFFREINVSRTTTNSVIYAGSNTMISREALEAVGGIAIGTITEDIATGIKIQELGYRTMAVDKELAHGLSPEDFTSLVKQRQRWGRGCVQVINKASFFKNKLSFAAKVGYFTSLLYWWTYFRRAVYMLMPVLYALFGVIPLAANPIQLLSIWLPFTLLSNIGIQVVSGGLRNSRWNSIFDTILFPYMVLPIIAESIGMNLKKFSVTPKDKVQKKNTEVRHAIPHGIFLLLMLVSFILCIYDVVVRHNYTSFISIFWLIYNIYMLSMAMIFLLGRVNYRSKERLYVEIPAILKAGNVTAKGKTIDISENGLAVFVDMKEAALDESAVNVQVAENGYCANLEGRVVFKQGDENGWRYSLQVTPLFEHDRREYFQIIYDRSYALSHVITSSALDELRAIAKGQKRKRP